MKDEELKVFIEKVRDSIDDPERQKELGKKFAKKLIEEAKKEIDGADRKRRLAT